MTPKLLVVLEDGPTWQRVIDYVGRVATGQTAMVLLNFLAPLPPGVEGGESGAAETERDRFEARADAQAQQLLAEGRAALLGHGLQAHQIVLDTADSLPGAVADEICAAAQRHGCDTIVLARHHKSMVREFFAGDPEEELLRYPRGYTVWLIE